MADIPRVRDLSARRIQLSDQAGRALDANCAVLHTVSGPSGHDPQVRDAGRGSAVFNRTRQFKSFTAAAMEKPRQDAL